MSVATDVLLDVSLSVLNTVTKFVSVALVVGNIVSKVVVVLFLAGLDNTTIPIQMWTGLREQLSPTILAVATCLIVLSTLILDIKL